MTSEPRTPARPHAVMQMTVEPGRAVPSMARTFVQGCVDVLGAHTTPAAILLTSEVVTNAVEHAHTDAVVVQVEQHGSHLRVEVVDEDLALPVLQPEDPSREGGFGVRLIDQLAASWGVDVLVDHRKRVWFEIDLPPDGSDDPPDPDQA